MADEKKYLVHPYEAEAPERIWAWGWRADSVWQEQTWQHEDEPMSTMEYVRADLFAALTEQLAAARRDAEEAEAYAGELEKERDEQIEWVKRLADDLIAAEAKLAKAVELALKECPFRWGTPRYDKWWQVRRTIIAELTGGKDE